MTTSLADARLGLQTALAALNSGTSTPRARPTKVYAPEERRRIRRRFHRTISGMQGHHTQACVDAAIPNAAALAHWLMTAWPLPGPAPAQCHVCTQKGCPDATVFVTTEATAEADFYEDWWQLNLPGLGVVFLIRSER
tara:strand:- start:495 stop:908 length:414 start_codon:yes stop_codon:yes gene_type:complete